MKHWLLILLTALFVRGDWSDDPGNPLNLGSGILPQVIPTSDGGAYVAWLSDGDFHIYLQRLDATGNPQWTSGGVLISDGPNDSWIAIHHLNLVVDATDNAIISTIDIRSGDWEVYAYKVDMDGNHIWDENGITLSSSGGTNISPRLTYVPTDTTVVVTWFKDYNTLRLQRVGQQGELLWGANGLTISTFNASLLSPQAAISSDGHILVQAIKQTGSFPAVNSQVVMQKYDLEGTTQWNAWIPVASAESFPMGNWLQDLQPDPSGGAFSSWTEMTTLNQTGKVQAVTSAGLLEWASAVEPSTTSDNFRVSPRLALPADSSGVYVVWGEVDGAQINRGIQAQRLDNSGQRLWGNGGMTIEPMDLSSFLDVNNESIGDDLLITYLKQYSFGTMDIFASRVQPDGAFVWEPNLVAITNTSALKADLNVARGSEWTFFTWSEGDSIKAHCLLDNGTLGIPGETSQDTINYFPMSVGQRWRYAGVYDSTDITVVDSFLIGEEVYYDMDNWFPNETVNAFSYNGMEVVVNSGAADQLLYDFGAEVNDTWDFETPGSYFSQMTFMSRGDTVTTPYGVFYNCTLFGRFIGSDYEYRDWFAPDMGLVQRDVITIAGPQRYQLYDIVQVSVSIDPSQEALPGELTLYQNYPNPFNPVTHINYELSKTMEVLVAIYDVKGRQVSVIHNGEQKAGNHTLDWNGVSDTNEPAPSGVYVFRIQTALESRSMKMLYLK